MRLHSIIKVTIGVLALLAASCSPDDAVFESRTDGKKQTYTLYLDADAPRFETVREGETRALGNSWEDGDVIYIAFSNGGNQVVVDAIYNANRCSFQFSTASGLDVISDAPCSVFYFRGGSYSLYGTIVTMDKHTAIFTDINAKYTFSNNAVVIRAAFKPYTWRLCFKGTVGSKVKLKSESNILYNSSLNLKTGVYSTQAESEALDVLTDGYTPYVYGLFSSTNNYVRIVVEGIVYTRTITSSKLTVGESGYFTIPISSNLYGWTKTGEVEESEINRESYGDDKNLDNTIGGGVDNTGSNDINKEDYGSDKNLDNASGGGVDNTGSNDINKEGYGSDKNLD